jgi:tRNA threonylcarbamoyladenosine biosynthesis protein TsaB
VAQGLAFGADVPVLPVDTLMAVAEEARWVRLQAGAGELDPESHNGLSGLTVLALLDARMDEVYSAAYTWQQVPEQQQGQWRDRLRPCKCRPPKKFKCRKWTPALCLAGNAFVAYGERLPSAWAHVPRCEALPTASALLRLAPALWAQGLAVPAEQAMPLYIRDKVANTTAEREALKALALQAHQSPSRSAAMSPGLNLGKALSPHPPTAGSAQPRHFGPDDTERSGRGHRHRANRLQPPLDAGQFPGLPQPTV